MHTKAIEIITAILLGIFIPALLILLLKDRIPPTAPNTEPTSTTAPSSHMIQPQIPVLLDNGEVIRMAVEEYVCGVVLCEMPADFELEALKAQAVVARTYAMRRVEKSGKHTVAAVCTKASCCQGFCTAEEYRSKGGKQESIDKIQAAIDATAGLVLMYEGELIDATYFSCSGGYTEDAQAVWGADIPYLQSVESPGEDHAARFVNSVTFTAGEFTDKLNLPKQAKNKITIERISYTEGNGIESICICGQTFTGTELRKKLKLRSTAFVISAVGDTVIITTKGYGHRVGMSQYGADAMAVNGANCEEILKHYYQGVALIPMEFD